MIIEHSKKIIERYENKKIPFDGVFENHDSILLYDKKQSSIDHKKAILSFRKQKAFNENFYRVKGTCNNETYFNLFNSLLIQKTIGLDYVENIINRFFVSGKTYGQFHSMTFSESRSIDLHYMNLVSMTYNKSKQHFFATFNYTDRSIYSWSKQKFKSKDKVPQTSEVSYHLDLIYSDGYLSPCITLFIPILADLKFCLSVDLNKGIEENMLNNAIKRYETMLREQIYITIKKIMKLQQHEKLNDVDSMSIEELIDYFTVVEMEHY